ncbi:hypothetical protein ACTFIW_002389 [Dictyostelium discoideum]
MDSKSSIVLEIGGRYTKCGYSPESSPRFIIPTNLLPLNISSYLSGGASFDNFKKEITSDNETITTTNQIPTELPTQSQLKESLFIFFKTIFLNYLLCKSEERKIIIVENIFLPRLFRESMVSVLFEQYRVPLIVFINPTASLIPTLRTTALLIDCGFSETRVLPIYEGVGILKAYKSISLGSESLINQLKHYLQSNITNGIIIDNQNNNQPITDSMICNQLLNDKILNSIQLLEDIITRCCFCSFKNKNNNNNIEINNINYRISKEYSILIDGNNIRKGLVDVLYKDVNNNNNNNNKEDDDDENLEEGNIATTILNTLLKCEHDQRKPLSHNILLLGGTTMLAGFKKRLVLELHRQLKINENSIYRNELFGLIGHFQFINHPFENNYLSWLGGSILATALEHVHSKITLDSYLNAPSQFKRSQLIPEWEKLTNINNYTQIAQATIGTTINPLQFNSTSSLFSPFTSSSDLSSHLNKD